MNAPSSAPVDWRSMYGFSGNGVQGQMSPYMADLWTQNVSNGSKEAIATNFMPYVMNPASISLDPAVNKQTMYSGGAAGGANAGAAPAATDPMTQILGLIQQNPNLLPLLLQNLQGQSGAGATVLPGG